MALKVAIVGLSPSTHDLAPWTDPAWEKWGLPWDGYWAMLDRTFEIHDESLFDTDYYAKGYPASLENCPRLYIQKPLAWLPEATVYPLEQVIADIGIDYFQSSVAYMLALAIHEKASEIALWGVDMGDDTEYNHQRANAEYLIGLARGRGIKVHIPAVSPVCKYVNELFVEDYPARYGWNT